jgi:hypothetical protein
MKRTFWTVVLLAIAFSSGWALYVGAQELQKQIELAPESQPKPPRFQFIDHFFLNQGQPYEVYLRLDRQSGQTWRYHATQSRWTVIREPSNAGPDADFEDRYELLSHVYRNDQGIQMEKILRVDYQSGRSWVYESMADRWMELEVEGAPSNQQPAVLSPAPKTAEKTQPTSANEKAATK